MVRLGGGGAVLDRFHPGDRSSSLKERGRPVPTE